MDNNDSNIKPQQTGGLKLMTVFIAVLALHVVVIGGFTVYHLMSSGNTDADLTTTDKTHKSPDASAVADSALPDASQGNKNASSAQTATPPTDVGTTSQPAPTPQPATVPQPAVITQAPSGPANPPVPEQITTTKMTVPPATLAPPAEVVDQGASPVVPISTELAPPAEPTPALSASVPSGPQIASDLQPASGPVHMPPPVASTPVHQHAQIYVVKITDSYKKIAHAHHITVAELKEANHITGNVLHTGQKLVISSTKTLVTETAPASAISLDGPPTALVLNESSPAPVASLASGSSTVLTTLPSRHLYTVVKGDTLTKIARKFKTTAAALMTENSITDPTKLSIGKKLKIPSGESRSARNAAPSSTQPSQVQTTESAPSAQLANFQR